MPSQNHTNPKLFSIEAAGPEMAGVCQGQQPACSDLGANPISHDGATAEKPSLASIEAFMEAMGRGDREAAARFVVQYGPQIRRRVRGKLRASMRRLFDSQDILSTLGRRLDTYVHRGRFTARSEGEFWSFIFTIAERSVVEKARIWSLINEIEGGDSADPFLRPFKELSKDEMADAIEPDAGLEELLKQIESPIDRQIARLWASGTPIESIAAEVGMKPTGVSMRWARTRDRLRAEYSEKPL